MSDGSSRRTFLQSLLVSVGAASFVRTVRPAEISALAGLEADEALEYDPEPAPGVTPLMTEVTASYARVRWAPLRLEHNCGFRYIARGRRLGSVRLYFARPGQPHMSMVNGDDGDKLFYMVDHGTLDFIEVACMDTKNGKLCEGDFDILCMKMGPPISTLTLRS